MPNSFDKKLAIYQSVVFLLLVIIHKITSVWHSHTNLQIYEKKGTLKRINILIMLNSPLTPLKRLLLPTIHALWIHFASNLRSEGRAKAKRRQGGGIVCADRLLCYTQNAPNQGATFEKKSGMKWDMMTMTITITIGMRPLFSPISHPSSQFTLFRLTL